MFLACQHPLFDTEAAPRASTAVRTCPALPADPLPHDDGPRVEQPCRCCGLPILRTHRDRRARCRQCRRHRPGGFAGFLFDERFRVKLRERRHPCRYPYVRRVAGRKYQLRVYVGGGRRAGVSVNLGLFESEWQAGQAMRKAVRLMRGPLDPLSVWMAVRPLVADGTLPPGLLPKYVFRRPDGAFGARVRLRGERVELGPFGTPEEACRAMMERLATAGRGPLTRSEPGPRSPS